MMKFLRQHNRKILAVVTAFILVSWLIGDPLRQLLSPDPSKTAVGSAFGKTITNGDLIPAHNTTEILEALGIQWRNIAGALAPRENVLSKEHWYLLVQEARRAGVNVGTPEIDDFFQSQRMPPQMLDFI